MLHILTIAFLNNLPLWKIKVLREKCVPDLKRKVRARKRTSSINKFNYVKLATSSVVNYQLWNKKKKQNTGSNKFICVKFIILGCDL